MYSGLFRYSERPGRLPCTTAGRRLNPEPDVRTTTDRGRIRDGSSYGLHAHLEDAQTTVRIVIAIFSEVKRSFAIPASKQPITRIPAHAGAGRMTGSWAYNTGAGQVLRRHANEMYILRERWNTPR